MSGYLNAKSPLIDIHEWIFSQPTTMDAILATAVDSGQAIVNINRVVGRNKLITHLINVIILNPLAAALANPSDGSPLRWIKRIY